MALGNTRRSPRERSATRWKSFSSSSASSRWSRSSSARSAWRGPSTPTSAAACRRWRSCAASAVRAISRSAIYFAQAIALGLFGAVLGAGLGIALAHRRAHVFPRQPADRRRIPRRNGSSSAQTTAAGFAVCCGFALIPLLQVRRISPAATLRDGAALEGRRVAGAAGLSVARRIARWLGVDSMHPDWKRALGLVGGLGVAFAVLVGSRARAHLCAPQGGAAALAVSAAPGNLQSPPSAQSDAALPALARARHFPSGHDPARRKSPPPAAHTRPILRTARTSISSMSSPIKSTA